MTRFLGRLGLRDPQRESEEFNEAFHVLTDNERFAYDVLSPTAMSWLLADPRARSHSFRFAGDHLVAWAEAEIEPGVAVACSTTRATSGTGVSTFVWRS